MSRIALESQIGCDFPDDRGKLKPVAGEAAAEDHVGVLRVTVDNKITVWRQAIHARFRLEKFRRASRHPTLHCFHNRRDVAGHLHLPFDFVRSGDRAVAMERGLEPVAKIRETIKRRGQSGAIKEKGREASRM